VDTEEKVGAVLNFRARNEDVKGAMKKHETSISMRAT
jgi:hypothetical protein